MGLEGLEFLDGIAGGLKMSTDWRGRRRNFCSEPIFGVGSPIVTGANVGGNVGGEGAIVGGGPVGGGGGMVGGGADIGGGGGPLVGMEGGMGEGGVAGRGAGSLNSRLMGGGGPGLPPMGGLAGTPGGETIVILPPPPLCVGVVLVGGLGGSPLGLGGGDTLPLIPLSRVLARSFTLPPPPRTTGGGDSCSAGSLVTGWKGSFFGDVTPRGVGTGRGFLARGGAGEEGVTV